VARSKVVASGPEPASLVHLAGRDKYFNRISSGNSPGQGILARGATPVAVTGSQRGQTKASNGTSFPTSANTSARRD
jgi:hypothetical protein